MLRLFIIITDGEYAKAAAEQGSYTAEVSRIRPNFKDCNGISFTGHGMSYKAFVIPSKTDCDSLKSHIPKADLEYFEKCLSNGRPFLIDLKNERDSLTVPEVILCRQRYEENTVASHLLGYLDYDGHGISGLERVFEDYLLKNTIRETVSVPVNARGIALGGAQSVRRQTEGGSGDITLTVDIEMQKTAEKIAGQLMKSGAVVVTDLQTSAIKAMVSLPDFDQNDIASAIAADNTALMNKALEAYNVGSVYKIVIAAAALEASDGNFERTCTGSIDIGGVTYTCNDFAAHGDMTLEKALEHSCNTYFIALGNEIGAEAIHNMALSMGLGKSAELCAGYSTKTGNIPSLTELDRSSELCNNCFGQGALLTTPIHIAQYTACVANDGVFTPFSIVKSVGEQKIEKIPSSKPMSTKTAQFIKNSLALAVEKGTGTKAKPQFVSAAGKTGTAQTGSYNEDGSEKLVGWFTGYFPAENPRYQITVMTVNEGYGYMSAAPIFARLADAIWLGFCS
ncbi:MAG: penicillin-binding transpeptidase domain-containing protein [Oscillospiraceae bacterium]